MASVKPVPLLLVAALILLSLGAFLKIASNVPPVTAPSNENPFGSVQGEMIGLPINFPADFAFYPGSTIISSNSSNESGRDQLSLLSEVELLKIKEFYTRSLLRQKWQLTGDNHYKRDDQQLELSFIQEKENRSLVIIDHSFVPTK